MFDAVVLGLIQGLTEFIPVSSSGHMVLYHALSSTVLSPEAELAYDAVLQLSTLLAVFVYFRKDIIELIQKFFAKEFLPIIQIVIATIPAVILGVLLKDYLTMLRGPYIVAAALIVGSAIMMYAEYFLQKKGGVSLHDNMQGVALSLRKALYIGFFQVLALIPGMSRSGMTVSGGVFNGLSREQAARFSFLISIPIIGGSGCLKLIEAFSLEGLNFLELGVSSAVSFCAGLGAIYIFMKIVSNKNLWPFIWYRLGLAVVVIVAAVIG